MRVLHLIDHLGPGGSQRLLLDLVELRAPGASHTVAVLTDRVLPEHAERLRRSGVAWTTLDAKRTGPAAALRLRSLLAELSPDVLHTQLDASNTVGPACAMSLGRSRRPAVVLTVENDPALHYGRLLRRTLSLLSPRVDACLLVSESLRRAAAPVLAGARRVEVVPPGVDLDHFRREGVDPGAVARVRGDAPLLVGSLGRLSRQKGHDLLLAAMPAVLAAHPGTRLLIAGEGPERAALEAQAARLGLSGAVAFLGHVAEPRAFLAALDLFVLASRHEGFGIVFLEAMAMGVPVLGTRVVGVTDAVRDGETGKLVRPEDPGALAAGILALLGDGVRRRALAEQGSRWVREHGCRRRMAARVQALWESLRRPGPAPAAGRSAPEPAGRPHGG